MQAKHRLFSGSIVALVTPMAESGEIDIVSLRELIDWHIDCGSHGLVIMGTTGESSTVTDEEFLFIVEESIKYTNHRVPVIVGCGAASTAKSVAIVERVNQFKPDGYLCVTPYYVKPNQEGLYQHYVAVADACDSPLILYNVPGRTSCDLTNETVVRLAHHDNIVGLKDAVGDIERAKWLFGAIKDDFCWLSGDDETAFDYVRSGGDGVISVTANIIPREMAEWCNELRNGDFEKAQSVFEKTLPLHHAMFVDSNPIPVKWAMTLTKQIGTGIRLPLTAPSSENKTLIEKALRNASVLN
jgi:4-hydroxy-tetrahydrodipicolinate synthase